LQQTNDQLEQKAQQLAERNVEVERKNAEIEQARRALEEKASELALTSKYKSEFLANMSHELRTPLNSILILSQQLPTMPTAICRRSRSSFAHDSRRGHRPPASDHRHSRSIQDRVGHGIGRGRGRSFASLIDAVSRQFRHEAERRSSTFDVRIDPSLGRNIVTDSKRLQQVLKNLMSNAFKFTEARRREAQRGGRVGGWSAQHEILNQAPMVVAFEVTDTGIGIPADKQKIIFEAFQQADASTSRKYGGTGLGLAICRELANLLGGELALEALAGRRQHLHALPAAQVRRIGSQRTKPVTPIAAPFRSSFMDGSNGARARDRAYPRRPVRSGPDDASLLIVEDDPHYARILADLARDQGFKV
jgi:signal transduction histidine kinase